MGGTKQTFTSDATQLLRDYEKIAKANTKLEEQLRAQIRQNQKAEQAQERTNKTAKNSTAQAVGQVRSMAASYVSLGGAIAIANQALEEQRRINSEISGKQVALASAQSDLIVNTSSEDVGAVKEFLASIRKANTDVGFGDESVLTSAASNLASTCSTFSRNTGSTRSRRPSTFWLKN